MNITIFGATGSLGSQCLEQSLAAGHDVTVLARNPSKLSSNLAGKTTVVEGNGLVEEDVFRALPGGTNGILFAVGVDKNSPEDLCTDVTRHILAAMRQRSIRRLVWCGGGSNLVDEDVINFGSRFVEFFARNFLGLRHRDKAHQMELLHQSRDVEWVGLRPLQMRPGPLRGEYRIGFDPFSGFSKITFADCAHGMLRMLEDDTWLHRAPIIQY